MTLTCPFQGSAYKRLKGVTRVHALRGDINRWAQQMRMRGRSHMAISCFRPSRVTPLQQTMKEKTPDNYKPWYFEQDNPLYFIDNDEPVVT